MAQQNQSSILGNLTLKFGPYPGAEPVTLSPGPMTVVVGPNNSGKSMLLREIASRIQKGLLKTYAEHQIIDELQPNLPESEPLRSAVLQVVTHDFEPIRRNIENATGTDLARVGAVEELGLAQIVNVISAFVQIKHVQDLAEAAKIDISTFSELNFEHALMGAPGSEGLVRRMISFAKEVIKVVEDNQSAIEEILENSEQSFVERLIHQGFVRLEGYIKVFKDHIILLDGRTRLGLVEPQYTHSLFDPPQNFMMRLRADRDGLQRLRALVYEAFGYYLSINTMEMSRAQFMLSDEDPRDHEYSTNDDAIAYFRKARPISEFSDGVRSYVGLQANLLSDDYRIILIDEPEAFLHPPLSRRLGETLTRLAQERGASVFAATHSPDFLMGCIEAQQSINVLRLGYRNEVPVARALSPSKLRQMMLDPLLRSTGVLGALFHQAAIVCEGDSDAAFYQEIAERIRLQDNERSGNKPALRSIPAIRDCVFVNSHGKGTLARLMGALRSVGIPTAAIIDLDAVNTTGTSGDLLKEAGVGASLSSSIGNLAGNIRKDFQALATIALGSSATDAEKLKKKTVEFMKKGGIKHLADAERRSLESYLGMMQDHGIFVVPGGELESWLPTLSTGIAKKHWLAEMFKKMGTPDDDFYVEPENDDVWQFIRDIGEWLDECSDDPQKLGIRANDQASQPSTPAE